MKGLETEWPSRQRQLPDVGQIHWGHLTLGLSQLKSQWYPGSINLLQTQCLRFSRGLWKRHNVWRARHPSTAANLQWDSLWFCHEVVIRPQRPWSHLDCGDIVSPRQGPGDRHCSTFGGDWENNSEIPFYTIISAQQKHLTVPCIDKHVEKRNFHTWLTGVWIDVTMSACNSEVTKEMGALNPLLEKIDQSINQSTLRKILKCIYKEMYVRMFIAPQPIATSC